MPQRSSLGLRTSQKAGGLRLRRMLKAIGLASALACMATGCGGAPKAYSWKPQAASQRGKSKTSASTRPSDMNSNVAGADLLEESHRAAKVTWVAVPTPDGKKMRWVQVQ